MSVTQGCDSGANLSHTILVVESDVLIRMPLAEYLRECGYRVFEAVDATEAKAVLQAVSPVNLVFAEVNPRAGENGFALARWIRLHHPEIEVLLTSSVPDAAAKAANLCEDLCPVAKPYEHASVLRRIQSLLHRARQGEPMATYVDTQR